ncbi:MAG: ATP-binding protein [Candidatus Margulisbacteria bacterium]|nr:ATP-binding protein [Candidatus Margulisiibacteriota bacterium]
MKRDIEFELMKWKQKSDRYPLLVRGARQVGKSYLVENFARSNFDNYLTINFELQTQAKKCFDSLDPKNVINNLQLLFGVKVEEDKTLLFFDEIQECPAAIMSLRYFREKMPQLAIIGAGSLLEFALKTENFKMPVGRIQFLYLEPLSFAEYLEASGNSQLREYLMKIKIEEDSQAAVHDRLWSLLRLYLVLGGMPAVVKEYLAGQNIVSCSEIQSSILLTYRSDFGKYAGIAQYEHLQKVFDAAPRLVGQRVKYVNIDSEIRSRDLKKALELLVLAGIIKPIYLSRASGMPLGSQINEKKMKINFLDVGLMQKACGLESKIALEKDLLQINSGSVAEQFVGQEIRAYSDKYQPSDLFFWAKEEKGSTAEVDYVISVDGEIYPVEVKAGKAGSLKSLRAFMSQKKAKIGIRVSMEKLSFFDGILSVPLYMLEQIPRLVRSVL